MKRQWLASPYIVWMVIFIVVPMLLILFYSITEQTEDGLQLTAEHFRRFIDPIYINVLIRSLALALACTAICLLLGYPMAAILASREYSRKKIMYMLIVLPMWMNFLLVPMPGSLTGEKRCNKHCIIYTWSAFLTYCTPTRRWCWAWFITSFPL